MCNTRKLGQSAKVNAIPSQEETQALLAAAEVQILNSSFHRILECWMSKARKRDAPCPNANSSQSPRGLRKEAERLKFVEWLALPTTQRKPKTEAELARQLGVEPATLSDWKQNPNLWQRYANGWITRRKNTKPMC